MQNDNAKSIYGNVNAFCNGEIYSKSEFSVLHLILELMYSSKEGQFRGFNSKGNAVFVEQTEYNSMLLENFQYQFNSIHKDYATLWEKFGTFSKEFAIGCLGLLLSKHSVFDEKLKKKFVFSDPYMGGLRTYNLVDKL